MLKYSNTLNITLKILEHSFTRRDHILYVGCFNYSCLTSLFNVTLQFYCFCETIMTLCWGAFQQMEVEFPAAVCLCLCLYLCKAVHSSCQQCSACAVLLTETGMECLLSHLTSPSITTTWSKDIDVIISIWNELIFVLGRESYGRTLEEPTY